MADPYDYYFDPEPDEEDQREQHELAQEEFLDDLYLAEGQYAPAWGHLGPHSIIQFS